MPSQSPPSSLGSCHGVAAKEKPSVHQSSNSSEESKGVWQSDGVDGVRRKSQAAVERVPDGGAAAHAHEKPGSSNHLRVPLHSTMQNMQSAVLARNNPPAHPMENFTGDKSSGAATIRINSGYISVAGLIGHSLSRGAVYQWTTPLSRSCGCPALQ